MSGRWGWGWVAAVALALPAMGWAAALNGGLDARIFGGADYNSGADLQNDFGIQVSPFFASDYGASVDYGWTSGFVAGVEFCDGPNRVHSYTAPGDSGTITVTNWGVLVTPGWRVSPAPLFLIEARLGLGVVAATESLRSDNYGTLTATGTGFGVWPEIQGEYEMGSIGIGLSVGYFASMVPAVEGLDGQVLQSVTADAATLHTEGISLSLIGVYHFTPVFQ
jgi:hypothetical protein